MYIESVPNRSSPPAILIRESYRDENGKVKKRTLANISKWEPRVIAGLKALFKGGHASDSPLEDQFTIERTLPHGHVAAVLGSMRLLGLPATLARKHCPERKLALALIAGRLLSPGSKLALSRQLRPDTATNTLAEELRLDDDIDEHDLYCAMRWLLQRQEGIEKRLAQKHMPDGTAVLYDLSSTYYEGSHCPIAQFGHNRDGKKGKRQINIGLLCNAEGCPIAVEVFPGATADPTTVESQLEKLSERFALRRVILVGDRGMLTSARIEQIQHGPRSEALRDYGWISALRSEQIRKLAESGGLQPELFDQRDLGEIVSEEHFPGERLVICRNPALAEERARKRAELLATTETKLSIIAAACQRPRRPYKGKDKIARRIERECAKHKMLKHFHLDIGETHLEFTRNQASIEKEAALDGFYVVRAGRIAEQDMDTAKLVATYKSLSHVERDFRNLKTSGIQVRPIFHREEDMVRAHILVCMLACHLRWHMEEKLAPMLFADEVAEGAPRTSPVAKAKRSKQADTKAATKHTSDGLPAHSFDTLMDDLATICRISARPAIEGAGTFTKLPKETPVQAKALSLLGVSL